MTNHWIDIRNADVVLANGANVAENHPIAFKYITEAIERGGTLIHVDPRFTRTSAKAQLYAPLRSGTDVAFYGGLINYILENRLFHEEYVRNYTNASFIVHPDFHFSDGYFSGWDPLNKTYDLTSWEWVNEREEPINLDDPAEVFRYVREDGTPFFELPKKKYALKDPTLQDPRCVFQQLKKHYSRYDPEMVSKITGMPKEIFLEVAKAYASTGRPGKAGTILYAMGHTQHSNGSQIIRAVAITQLLLGNIGIAGGGVNALRGEANVQGSTDMALLYNNVPGYLAAPYAEHDPTLAAWLEEVIRPTGFNQNRPKFIVSLLKAWWGDKATFSNDYLYEYLPKYDRDRACSHLALFDEMARGGIKGMFLWGQNPVVTTPNSVAGRKAMERLEWLVVSDLWETESAAFWKAPGADPTKISTEVFLLPAAASFEKEGSVSNSGRWIQWRWKAVDPPGDAKSDLWILDRLGKALMSEIKKGGRFAGPILDLTWDYSEGNEEPDVAKVALEINGFTVADEKPLTNFLGLMADGSTACGNWIYSGYFSKEDKPPAEQPTGSRKSVDGPGLGSYLDWSFAWPVNRRILYNRCSADLEGKPFDDERWVVRWDGAKWATRDVPDFGAKTAKTQEPIPPEVSGKTPFIMLPEGMGRLFVHGWRLTEGPFPEHYEPVESPVKNLLSSVQYDPLAKIFYSPTLGKPDEFPYVMTTIRVAEHWQGGTMSRNLPWLVEAMPEMFVELSEQLAAEKGIRSGDVVVVWNKRGEIEAKAMVTSRLKPFKVNGSVVHEVAAPWHWGFAGAASGASINDLTPSVGDANTDIPEYKAFLVNLKRKGA